MVMGGIMSEYILFCRKDFLFQAKWQSKLIQNIESFLKTKKVFHRKQNSNLENPAAKPPP